MAGNLYAVLTSIGVRGTEYNDDGLVNDFGLHAIGNKTGEMGRAGCAVSTVQGTEGGDSRKGIRTADTDDAECPTWGRG